MEEATWLSPIVVVPKKNRKLWICVDFQNLNIATTEFFYHLPFTEEVLDMATRHEVYLFLDGFLDYHQIMIALEGSKLPSSHIGEHLFDSHAFWIEECSTNLPVSNEYDILWIPWGVREIVYRWVQCIQWLENASCQTSVVFWQCGEFYISLNPYKCMFLVYSGAILGYVVSKAKKLPDLKKKSQRLSICPHQKCLTTYRFSMGWPSSIDVLSRTFL